MRSALTASRMLAFCTECSALVGRARGGEGTERTRAERRVGTESQRRVHSALVGKCTQSVDFSHRLNDGAALHGVAGGRESASFFVSRPERMCEPRTPRDDAPEGIRHDAAQRCGT